MNMLPLMLFLFVSKTMFIINLFFSNFMFIYIYNWLKFILLFPFLTVFNNSIMYWRFSDNTLFHWFEVSNYQLSYYDNWWVPVIDYMMSNMKFHELSDMNFNFNFLTPTMFLGFCMFSLLMYSFFQYSYKNCMNFTVFLSYMSLMVLFFQIFLLTKGLEKYRMNMSHTYYYLYTQFEENYCMLSIKLFLGCIFFVFLLLSMYYFTLENFGMIEYPLMMLLSYLTMQLLVSVNDLFVMYMLLELQALIFLMLMGFGRSSNISTEATLKNFMYSSFSSMLMMYAISLMYMSFGTLNFNEISMLIHGENIINNNILLYLSFVMMTMGFLFKLAIAPFHFWMADMYEGTMLIMTLFFTTIPKLPYFVLFMKLNFLMFSNIFINNIFLFNMIALFSIAVGTMISLYQVKLKSFIAYGWVSNAGFMLLILVSCGMEKISIFSFFMIVYIILSFNLFSMMLGFSMYSNFDKLTNLNDFAFLSSKNMFFSISLAIFLCAYAGLPPFIGFWAKFLLFIDLFMSNQYFVLMLVIMFSILSSFYYMRLMSFCLFNNSADKIFIPSIKKMYMYMFSICLYMNGGFCFLFMPLYQYLIHYNYMLNMFF